MVVRRNGFVSVWNRNLRGTSVSGCARSLLQQIIFQVLVFLSPDVQFSLINRYIPCVDLSESLSPFYLSNY